MSGDRIHALFHFEAKNVNGLVVEGSRGDTDFQHPKTTVKLMKSLQNTYPKSKITEVTIIRVSVLPNSI
jgi:hypothetical protein